MEENNFYYIKYYLFLSIYILTFLNCSDQNEFEYNGEYPEWEYKRIPNGDEVFESLDENSNEIAHRNRIYVTFDSSLNILLNGHFVSVEDFESNFKFVYTNPKKLIHLPEASDKAAIYYAIDFSLSNIRKNLKPSLSMMKKQLELSEAQLKIHRVIQGIREDYITKEYGIPIDKIDSIQQVNVEQKYPLNYFVYSPIFAGISEDRGITVKLPKPKSKEVDLKERNIIRVLLKQSDKVLLRGAEIEIDHIRDQIKKMIINEEEDLLYPESPKEVIITLRNEKDVKYDVYLKIYNGILNVYQELWEEKSQEYYNKKYSELNREEQKKIKLEIPLMLSEAEQTSLD